MLGCMHLCIMQFYSVKYEGDGEACGSTLIVLTRGTSKNSEKVPYYFLCQQQNICILNCTNISLQILGCECSLSMLCCTYGQLKCLIPESLSSSLCSCLGTGDSARVPCYPCFLYSFFPAFTQIYMYFSLLWFGFVLVFFSCCVLPLSIPQYNQANRAFRRQISGSNS